MIVGIHYTVPFETPEGFLYTCAVVDDFGDLVRTRLQPSLYHAYSSSHDEHLLRSGQTPDMYRRTWRLGSHDASGVAGAAALPSS